MLYLDPEVAGRQRRDREVPADVGAPAADRRRRQVGRPHDDAGARERPSPVSRTIPSSFASARTSLITTGAGAAPARSSATTSATPRPEALADSR